MAKETFYFTHDYNARTDPKIKKLMAKHGMAGYGIFWSIVEDLYNNENCLPAQFDTIAFDLRCNEHDVKSIISDFGLFIVKGDFFGSLSVQKRLDDRAEKSKKARDSAMVRWSKNILPEIPFQPHEEPETEPETNANASDEYANALQTQSDSNAIKESKGKESKEKETKEEKFDFKKSIISLGVEEKIASDWLLVRKAKRAANTETAFKAIKAQIDISGFSANECVRIAAEKSWQGLKAEWIINEINNTSNGNKSYSGNSKSINPNDKIYCGVEK